MSHANAALTPRQRLRLARQVVDDGWSIAAAAAYFRVSYPTAAKWARRYEGWDMVDGPTAYQLKSNQKLSRSLELSNVFVFHKGKDIAPDSPGQTVISEAQSIYMFRQDRPEDADWEVRTFDFEPSTGKVLQELQPGHCIFKYGSQPETHVQHIRYRWEQALTDTDEAMQLTAWAPMKVITSVLAGIIALVLGVAFLLSAVGTHNAGCGKADASQAGGRAVAGYSSDQLVNAATIMNTATDLGLSSRAQLLGVMAAMGESGLRTLTYGD